MRLPERRQGNRLTRIRKRCWLCWRRRRLRIRRKHRKIRKRMPKRKSGWLSRLSLRLLPRLRMPRRNI
jgi:hypothetical protein